MGIHAALAPLAGRKAAVLHGGQPRHGIYLSDMWLLELANDASQCTATEVLQRTEVPRYCHTLHAFGSLLLIVGGADRLGPSWDISSEFVHSCVLETPCT